MRKNTRFLWIYTGILFTTALILIIIAYFTQSNGKFDVQNQAHGMQTSVTQITQENTLLKAQIAEKDAEIANINAEMEKYKAKEHEWLTEKGIDETLATAYEKYVAGEKEEAKSMVKASCDRSKLTSIQLKIYDIIIND